MKHNTDKNDDNIKNNINNTNKTNETSKTSKIAPEGVVSRFAPSPTMTGSDPQPHLGFYRTLYHSWLAARGSFGGRFILRIDDTDQERSTTENIDLIMKALDDVGIDYDSHFKQSERFDRYTNIAEILLSKEIAIQDNGCIRLNKELIYDENDSFISQHNKALCDWEDQVSGEKKTNDHINEFAFSQVIMKSDGSPVYNFCTVIDDLDSKVTDIIRGTDHVSNTYKQVVIYNMLNKAYNSNTPLPRFHHVGLVCNPKGAKLSKRESNDLNLTQYNKEALLNFVLRMGWGPYVDNKDSNIIDKERAIQMFWKEGKLKASNSKINISKLEYLNKKYSN